VPYGERASVTLNGTFIDDSQTKLAVQQALMNAAVAQPYRDLILTTDAGGVVPVSLLNRSSLTGVRKVSGPTWQGTGAGYSTFLTFSDLRFEADYPLPAGGPQLIDFVESVTTDGGNYPEFGFLRPVNADAIKQRIYPSSPYTAVQSGASTHLSRYYVPPPLWPGDLMHAPRITRTPKRVGPTVVHFETTWQYDFGSTRPLLGLPHIPPPG
jgi:hypothetical protein